MKAIILNETGSVENLHFQDVDKPSLKKGEVLVNIKAISINPADVLARSNQDALNWSLGEQRPVILGWDISGEITEKAEQTDEFEIGEAVFGMLEFFKGGKGYAEYVAAPVSVLAHKPENITHAEAAAATMAALTAWKLLVYEAKIKKGDSVLIHGGSGGVGHFAVQIAKYLGATIIATSSAKNRDFVLSLGADQHIDYNTRKFYEEIDNIDVVLDIIGGDTRAQSINVIKEKGKLITLIPGLTEELKKKASEKHIDLLHFMSHSSAEDMTSLANLLSKGIIKPHISATYPFSHMGKAHTQVGSGHTVGKVVVTL